MCPNTLTPTSLSLSCLSLYYLSISTLGVMEVDAEVESMYDKTKRMRKIWKNESQMRNEDGVEGMERGVDSN